MTSRGASYDRVDVAVAGGGVIGCAIALELARRGASVAIVERGSIGREASWASAGLISPPSDRSAPPAKSDLISRGVLGYVDYIERLVEETGIDLGWRQRGELIVAQNEEELRDLEALADWHEGLGFHSEILDRETALELEPVLTPNTVGALLTHEAGNLVAHRLTRAMATAAELRGARVIEHTPAMGVTTEAERVTGLRLPDGVLPAGQVVLAAGAWTAELGAMIGYPIPTVPVKGQMLAVTDPPIMPRRVIYRFGWGYLFPRTDGTVAVGATKEWVGFDKRVIASGIGWCLDLIEDIAPSMPRAEVTATWAGLRPGSADDLPIMGPVPGYQGLWVATGHYHTGVQMAPGTATVMAGAILDGARDPTLDAFGLERFGAPS